MNEETDRARRRLVERLREQSELSSPIVTRAMKSVPREEFVPDAVREQAYTDRPLDIGEEQVITAPHLVARMTELLEVAAGHQVLEIGTGRGYHAAVIAEIVGAENVVTIERQLPLANAARRNLARTGYENVTVVIGDGSNGLPDSTPYDRINVTCAVPSLPPPLVDQLALDGRMVIPVGHDSQTLELVTNDDGIERSSHGPVRFVPLIGDYGFESPPVVGVQ